MPIIYSSPATVNGLPHGNERLNAEGSPYLALSPADLDAISTSDLTRVIIQEIFDTHNERTFDSLKHSMMSKTPIMVTDDVFSWDEMPDQRMGITIDDGASAPGVTISAAVAAVPGDFVTQTVPVAAATMQYIGLNMGVAFSPTQHAVVTAMPTATTITITSLVGEGIPAIIQGAVLTTMGEIVGDHQEGWRNSQRHSKLQRTNFLATFRRAIHYGRKELIKLEENSRNNNLEMDRKNLLRELKYDALVNMWIGRKGTRRLNDGTYAKGMDGIHTQMVQGGATFGATTMANLAASFELNAMNTNFQMGGVRNVYARQELLTIMSKHYKELHVRFRPEDNKANLDLEVVQVGGSMYRFIPVEAFGDPNYFPGMANHMYVVDDNSLTPVEHKRLPMFDLGGIMAAKRADYRGIPQNVADNITRRDYSTRDAELNFSLRMIDPKKSFCLVAS